VNNNNNNNNCYFRFWVL